MSVILFLYLVVELLLLLFLCNKYRTPNAIVLSYIVFLLYAQSNYLDYLISGKSLIDSTTYFSLRFSINSFSYFLASSCYFFFLFIFAFIGLFSENKIISKDFSGVSSHYLNSKNKIIILLCIIYTLYFHFLTFELDRASKKVFDLFSYDFLLFYYLFYSWGYELLYAKKKSFFFYLMTFVISLHTILSFEREFIVLAGLFLLFKYTKIILLINHNLKYFLILMHIFYFGGINIPIKKIDEII